MVRVCRLRVVLQLRIYFPTYHVLELIVTFSYGTDLSGNCSLFLLFLCLDWIYRSSRLNQMSDCMPVSNYEILKHDLG